MRPAPGVTAPRRAGERVARYNGVDQYGTANWIANRVNPFEAGGAFTLLVRSEASSGVAYSLAGWTSAAADYAPIARAYVDASGVVGWYVKSTATAYKVLGPVIADGTEHSVALVDNAGAVAWFLDGVADATGAITRTGLGPANQFSVAAIAGVSPAQYMPGDVAEVAVLDVALTADEIARWSDGTLDLLAYGEHLVAWFWPGDPPATTSAAPNMGGQRDVMTEINAPSIVEAT